MLAIRDFLTMASNEIHQATGSPFYLIVVAFFSGMAVMGVEMCAGRLMAPFFGTSISIWTTIIGSTMIALTIGYYSGGLLAEKYPRISVLSSLLCFAAAYTIFLPYIAQPVMDATLGRFAAQADGYSAGSAQVAGGVIVPLVVCAVLISAPVVIMGMTSPFIIRLDSLRSSQIGRVAGKVFAFSTLGSILGTFLPALFLIPLLGTRLSFYFFGALLLGVSIWSVERKKPLFWSVALAVAVTGLVMGLQGWGVLRNPHLVNEKETNYQRVRVFKAPVDDAVTGEKALASMLLADAGFGIQSLWLEGRPYTDSWQDLFVLGPRIFEVCNSGAIPKRVLLVGLGGACAPYLISQFYPDAVFDGVEIDGGLLDAAAPYFPFALVKNLKIHVGDGRMFVRSGRQKYDVIIVDAFRPPHIPFHLATAEFFSELRERLAEDGILTMNVGSRGKHQVLRGIANTAGAVFPDVYFAKYHSPGERSLFDSYLLVASSRSLHLERRDLEDKIFAPEDPRWSQVFGRMRDIGGLEPGQESYFRQFPIEPQGTLFLDDRSSLEVVSEREFLGLILGRER